MVVSAQPRQSRSTSESAFGQGVGNAPSKEWQAQLKDLHTTIQINKDVIKGLIEAQSASSANVVNQTLSQALEKMHEENESLFKQLQNAQTAQASASAVNTDKD